jgi:PAS domain S-box-containing protein
MLNWMYLLETGLFIPHGHCYLWKPELIGLHLFSDAIALSYYSIPLTLFYFVWRQRDLPFTWIFLLFSAFIVACGTTHLLEIWTLWHPTYWLSGLIKLLTAFVSGATAILLVPLVPKALALPSPAELKLANKALQREITERQQAELAIQQSEARYRAIVEDQTELIVRFQPDGILTFVNDAYCRYFGIEREMLVGHQYEPIIFADDRETVAQQIHLIESGSPTVTIENRVVVGGEVRWTQWVNRAFFDEQGNLSEVQAVGRDIHKLKQAEEALRQSDRRFRAIFNTMFQFIGLLTPEGILLEANQTALEFAGLTHEDVINRPFWEARWWTVSSETQAHLKAAIAQAATGQFIRYQVEVLGAGDATATIDFSLKPIHDEAGQVVLLIPEGRDISQQKQATEQLQATLKEKEVLLKEIHHRVKNNLGIVDGLLQMQSRRSQSTEIIETLKESQNRIASIALVHEKLYRSRDLASIDFSQYIPDLTAHLFASYNTHSNHIKLVTQLDDISLDIDTAIPCGLIINELVSNALKYAFPNGHVGEVDVKFYKDVDGAITLVVKDNGVGLPENFELKQTKTLGMKLVQGLVKQLKGRLEIDSQQGTAFRITIKKINQDENY